MVKMNKKDSFDAQAFDTLLKVFYGAKMQAKQAEDKQKELRSAVENGVEQFGYPVDKKTKAVATPNFEATLTQVSTKKFNEHAVEMLRERKLDKEVCDLVPNMDRVQRLIAEGRLTNEEFEAMIAESGYSRLVVKPRTKEYEV